MLEVCHAVDSREMRDQLLDDMELERERGITIKARAVTIWYEKDGVRVRAQPDRHTGPRRLQLRGREEPAGLRGRPAPGRRGAGRRGPDGGERLPGGRGGPRDHPGPEQDRPRSTRGPTRSPRRSSTRSGSTPPAPCTSPPRPASGVHRGARRRSSTASRPPDRGSERPAPGTDLRRPVRRVPRDHRLPARRRRHDPEGRSRTMMMSTGKDVRGASSWGGSRRKHDEDRRASERGRGGLLHLQHQEPRRRADRGHDDPLQGRRGRDAPAGLPAAERTWSSPTSIRPANGDFEKLRESLETLTLSDSSFSFDPVTSDALGLRVPVRLPRPPAHGDRPAAARARARHGHDPDRADGDLQGRAPRRGGSRRSTLPGQLPEQYERLLEPIARATIILPSEFIGAMMQITNDHRGELRTPGIPVSRRASSWCTTSRLAEIIYDFYDKLKSATLGLRHAELRGHGLRGRRPRQAPDPGQRQTR